MQRRVREEGAGSRLPEARTAADNPKEVLGVVSVSNSHSGCVYFGF